MRFNTPIGKTIYELKAIENGGDLISGYAFKGKDFSTIGYPIIKIKNIQNGIVNTKVSEYIPFNIITSKLDKFKLLHGDVLIAMTGQGSVGRVGKLTINKDETPYLNQRVGKFISDEKILNIDYLYYILNSKGYEKLLFDAGTGSGQPNLSPGIIKSVKIPFPPYLIQKKIAHILSTLDDKIVLGRKMNQTLESMAQTLFKSWFVDFDPVHAKLRCKSEEELEAVANELGISKNILELFPSEFEESELGMIPKGWEVKTIKDFGRVVTGKTPPKKIEDAYNIKGKPFITPTDIDDSLFVTNTARYLSDSGQEAVKNSILPEGSICVTCIGSQMGKTTVASSDSCTNQQVNSIILSKDILRNYLLCNLRGRKKEIFLLGSGGGSTMPLLNKSSFEKIDVLLPSISVIEAFDSSIKDNISMIFQNDIENNSLKGTRDTLLPKLLSGEVEV